jgi:hypothetical protein
MTHKHIYGKNIAEHWTMGRIMLELRNFYFGIMYRHGYITTKLYNKKKNPHYNDYISLSTHTFETCECLF